jgi:hypothetical protein
MAVADGERRGGGGRGASINTQGAWGGGGGRGPRTGHRAASALRHLRDAPGDDVRGSSSSRDKMAGG